MKAIAVFTGKPNTAHLTEVPKPTLDQIPNGRGVDKEINAAEYGTAPHVIRGHIVGANQVVNACLAYGLLPQTKHPARIQ